MTHHWTSPVTWGMFLFLALFMPAIDRFNDWLSGKRELGSFGKAEPYFWGSYPFIWAIKDGVHDWIHGMSLVMIGTLLVAITGLWMMGARREQQ